MRPGAPASSPRSPTTLWSTSLVIGGGITGAGLALDAASRGLRTVLVERHDLAHGTSRWSSKLVHGGLRYLASGQLGIAHESAAERHLLLTRIAPHLTRSLAQVRPAVRARPSVARRGRRGRLRPGRRSAPIRRHAGRGAAMPLGAIGSAETLRLAPGAARRAPPRRHPRLGRTAHRRRPARRRGGADGGRVRGIRPHPRRGDACDRSGSAPARHADRSRSSTVSRARGDQRDRRLGGRTRPRRAPPPEPWHPPRDRCGTVRAVRCVAHRAGARARAADSSSPCPPRTAARTSASPTCPPNGPIPDEPQATEAEIDLLLTVDEHGAGRAAHPRRRDRHLRGAAAALTSAHGEVDTSDLSRRHAILESADGVLTVVGGKLTTYRRMAQDGIDEAVRRRALPTAQPSRTRALPLVGAWPRERLAEIGAPASPSPALRSGGAVRRSTAGRAGRRARRHRAGTRVGRTGRGCPDDRRSARPPHAPRAGRGRPGCVERMPRPPPSRAPGVDARLRLAGILRTTADASRCVGTIGTGETGRVTSPAPVVPADCPRSAGASASSRALRCTSRRCSAPDCSCCPGSPPRWPGRRASSRSWRCSGCRCRWPARSRCSRRAIPTRVGSPATCGARSVIRRRG